MRSPNWNESELMLALDLYLNKDLSWFNKMSDRTFEIVMLSKILNSLDFYSEKPNNFRSPGSIRMKLANFMALDNRYKKQSLGNVGGLDKKIWNEFSKKPQELHSKCKSIFAEHLKSTDGEINQYIENLYANDSLELVEKDFVKFAKNLNRMISYYEEFAKNNPQNEYSKEIVESSRKIKKTLQWTETIESLPLDFVFKEHGGINLKPVKGRKPKTSNKKTPEEKIGKYIQRTFKELVDQDKLSNEMIDLLQTHQYSKDFFGLKPTFLVKIDPSKDVREQITDENGYVRYWTSPIVIYGEKYCVCKEWFEDKREKYTRWLNSVNVHPFYMLKPKELKRILEYLKENDSKKINISKQDIVKEFPFETIDEVLNILIDKGILTSFQGSSREYVLDDYDALFKMLNNPSDYSGE